jgi:hypothetical protein
MYCFLFLFIGQTFVILNIGTATDVLHSPRLGVFFCVLSFFLCVSKHFGKLEWEWLHSPQLGVFCDLGVFWLSKKSLEN